MSFWLRIVTALAVMAGVFAPVSASGAQTLAQVQAKIRQLEEDATAAAEGAQEAKVKLAALTKTLNGIKAKAEIQGQTVAALQKSLGAIAIEQYKTGGFGQSFELLFSSDPSLYLSSAGALDAITRRKSAQLRKFETAQQRLNATTLTVNDKLALVAAAQKKLTAQSRLGKKVSLNALKPGDLLFYGRPISHVSIYLGGGKMVHAPRSGSRVKVAPSGSLGRKPLVGARRF